MIELLLSGNKSYFVHNANYQKQAVTLFNIRPIILLLPASLTVIIKLWSKNRMSKLSEHSQMTPQPGIFDAGELVKILGDDSSAINDLSEKYLQLLKEQRTQIQQALNDSNWEAAANLAHQLKSSSRIVGAFALADCCESIEHAGKSAPGTISNELISDFDSLAILVLEAVGKYLQIPVA